MAVAVAVIVDERWKCVVGGGYKKGVANIFGFGSRRRTNALRGSAAPIGLGLVRGRNLLGPWPVNKKTQ